MKDNSLAAYLKIILLVLILGVDFCCYSQSQATTTMDKNFVQTNGEFVRIGGILVKTNSPLNTEAFKQYMRRNQQLRAIANSGTTNATDLSVVGAWTLIRDYPQRANGYQDIMAAIEDYQFLGQTAKAQALAKQLIDFSIPAKVSDTSMALRPDCHPESFKQWARGFLNRLASFNKPISMQFTAVDGSQMDLSKMKGKVVLVDFWATGCVPCVAELPEVKAAYDKFHSRGFEVIGVSCDTDKNDLMEFLKNRGYPWPQYFDGKQQGDNKFTTEFGIHGIPHMFLVDKHGLLRFDNVRAANIHPKGDTTSFEQKISILLGES